MIHRDTEQHHSDRLIPLLWWGPTLDVPILTMECVTKWHEMWLIKPDYSVEKVDWDALAAVCRMYETYLLNNAPNPDAVERLCVQMGWHFHPVAKEIMYTRFQGKI